MRESDRTFYFFATQPMVSLGGFSVSIQMNSMRRYMKLNNNVVLIKSIQTYVICNVVSYFLITKNLLKDINLNLF